MYVKTTFLGRDRRFPQTAKGLYSNEGANSFCLAASAVGSIILSILQMRKLKLDRSSHLSKGTQLRNDEAWT